MLNVAKASHLTESQNPTTLVSEPGAVAMGSITQVRSEADGIDPLSRLSIRSLPLAVLTRQPYLLAFEQVPIRLVRQISLTISPVDRFLDHDSLPFGDSE
jgi:hypothetical protein